jgi:hypothetical protein
MLPTILKTYGLEPSLYQIVPFGSGLINYTWKITDQQNEDKFILQQINKNVFQSPFQIAENIDKVSEYLAVNNPGYFFPAPLLSPSGQSIIKHTDGEYYRLLPFVKNSVTITTVQTSGEAFEAASQFAQFTCLLSEFNTAELHYILPGFHDLAERFKQFLQAIKTASPGRLIKAQGAIDKALQEEDIAKDYEKIVKRKLIPLRVIHHDTKISNVLFDAAGKGICVIDLDTVMPGYYISDVGDMMRTYLSPYSEEEQDHNKLSVREDFFEAIATGYFNNMGAILTEAEKSFFVYAGKFMIYMQALRFLTDYLNNDTYYGSSYPGHNLVRAQNQLVLLEKYVEKESRFEQIIDNCNKALNSKVKSG